MLGMAAYTGAQVFSGPISVNLNATLTVTQPFTFSGVVSGSNGFTKAGSSTLTLSAANPDLTGTVKITAGTLSLTNINALQNAIVDWGTATVGSLTYSANTTLGGLNTTSGTNNGIALGSAILIGNANQSETFGGVISGAGAITKVGTGVWTLTGNNTRDATTTILGGELVMKHQGALGVLGTSKPVIVGSVGDATPILTLDGFTTSPPGKVVTLYGVLQSKNANTTWSGTQNIQPQGAGAVIRNATAGTTFTISSQMTPAAGSTVTFDGVGDVAFGTAYQAGTNTTNVIKNNTGRVSVGSTMQVGGGKVTVNAGTFELTSNLTGTALGLEVNGGSFIFGGSSTIDGTFGGTGGNIASNNVTQRTLTIGVGELSTYSGYFGGTNTNGNNFALSIGTTGTQLILRGTTSSTHTGTTSVGASRTLDSAHTFSSSTVSASGAAIVGAGGWDGSTGGLGDFTMPTLTFTGADGTIRSSKANAATAPSKVVVTGTLTKPTTTLTILGAGTGWSAGTQYEVASAAGMSGTNTVVAGAWTDSANARIGGGTATIIGTSIYLTPAATNVSTTWAGGDAGTWFNGQTTGWSASGPAFLNGDTVVFGSGNTTTATLTSDVSVASLTFNGSAPQTINGTGFSITNAGALNVSAGVKTVNVAMTTAGTITVAASGTLVVGHVNALAGTGTAFNMNANQAAFTTSASVTTSRTLSLLSSAGTNTFTKVGGSTLSFGGIIIGSASSGIRPSVFVKGHGVLEFTPTTTYLHYNIYEVDDSTTTPGQNVYRTVNVINAQNTGLKLGSGGIYENATSATTNMTRAYGSAANQFQVASGGGFSRKTAGTMTVSANLTYGTSAATEWVGAAYFGTAFGTQEGSVTFSGTQNLNGQTQTFHVFNGATTAGSSATISGKISGSGVIVKDGPGKLTVSNATNDFTASVEVDDGTLVAGSANVLNSRDVTVAANKTLQTLSTSGVALRTGNLTLGAGARIIVGA